VYGLPGTGKTSTIVHVVQSTIAEFSAYNVVVINVNGMCLQTANEIYTQIWCSLSKEVSRSPFMAYLQKNKDCNVFLS
jgi:Cdc6-like AAA superfamily ATPase